jgi:hypothetical protein
MHRKLLCLAFLAALGASGVARAGETATIRNDSNVNVGLFLKWASQPESPLIVLAPGEFRRFSSFNGDVLYIRYNSTPAAVPPREESYRVITLPTLFDPEPGYTSSFRNVAPNVVHIF